MSRAPAAVAAGHRRARRAPRDCPPRRRRHATTSIVVDTAPTGHTLRMLATPETLRASPACSTACRPSTASWSRRSGAAGGRTPRTRSSAKSITRPAGLRHCFAIRERARFSWVTLPEPMAIEETADAAMALAAAGITLSRHHRQPDHAAAGAAVQLVRRTTNRRSGECQDGAHAAAWSSLDSDRGARPRSHEGCEPSQLSDPRSPPSIGSRSGKNGPGGRRSDSPVRPAGGRARPTLATDDTRLVLFGGKGGVGKTTCAAAAAIGLAGQFRSRRGPAAVHRSRAFAGDVLGVPVSDETQPVRGASGQSDGARDRRRRCGSSTSERDTPQASTAVRSPVAGRLEQRRR